MSSVVPYGVIRMPDDIVRAGEAARPTSGCAFYRWTSKIPHQNAGGRIKPVSDTDMAKGRVTLALALAEDMGPSQGVCSMRMS